MLTTLIVMLMLNDVLMPMLMLMLMLNAKSEKVLLSVFQNSVYAHAAS